MKIALTGGMGCGKSRTLDALAEILRETYLCAEDAYRYDSYDAEILRMYRSDKSFKSMLRAELGTDIRSEVATIVFNDPVKLKWLIEVTDAPMRNFLTRITSFPNVVVEVPMLFEIHGIRDMFDIAIAVWCDEETQLARIRKRDNISEDRIRSKLAVGLSADERARRADYVIDTSDGAVDVYEQLEVVLRVAKLDFPG